MDLAFQIITILQGFAIAYVLYYGIPSLKERMNGQEENLQLLRDDCVELNSLAKEYVDRQLEDFIQHIYSANQACDTEMESRFAAIEEYIGRQHGKSSTGE